MTGKGRAMAGAAQSKSSGAQLARSQAGVESRALKTGRTQSMSYANKKGNAEVTYSVTPNPKGKPSNAKTGTTTEAPKATPRNEAIKQSAKKNKETKS